MRSLPRMVVAVLAAVGLAGAGGAGADAADRLRIVTTLTDLKALTEAVGGDLVEVEALARGNQNPHDLEVRPSLMVKARRADALVVNGLGLDEWVEAVAQGANNARIMPGAAGRIDASHGIPVLEVPTGKLDRSMGDVHPGGNPHYTLDPGLAPIVTANIAEGLARLAPQHRAAFEQRRQEFLARLAPAMARWAQMMEPLRGARVATYHTEWVYLLARFGLTQVGTVEERPGIPPSPAHLSRLIRVLREGKVKAVITAPWGDQKLTGRIAQESGAQVVVLASGVGSLRGTDTYLDAVGHNVSALAQALK